MTAGHGPKLMAPHKSRLMAANELKLTSRGKWRSTTRGRTGRGRSHRLMSTTLPKARELMQSRA